MFRCLNWNLRLSSCNKNSYSSEISSTLCFARGCERHHVGSHRWVPQRGLLCTGPVARKEGNFSDKLWGCTRMFLLRWTASEMTFLMANKITEVLVICKSYRNDFFLHCLAAKSTHEINFKSWQHALVPLGFQHADAKFGIPVYNDTPWIIFACR